MQRILIQLDTDPLPSSFDRVVAVDAGVDQLFSYGGITPENVDPIVQGAIFTRKPSDLKHTALFVGGCNVAAGELVYAKVCAAFFDPMRVSVMMDSNGSNTTAAATVLAASRHLDLAQSTALVLGGTGPVGMRVAQILLQQGTTVRLSSRSLERGQAICERLGSFALRPNQVTALTDLDQAKQGVQLIVAAGAVGARFLSRAELFGTAGLQLAIDLNAVPPSGLEGVELMDKGVVRDGVICYGAIGVGGTKMRIHHAAIQRLFESNTQRLETNAIFEIGKALAK